MGIYTIFRQKNSDNKHLLNGREIDQTFQGGGGESNLGVNISYVGDIKLF